MGYLTKTKSVVQTIAGHTATVLSLVYSKKSDTLFSASVDKTVRVWK
jgi:WD40 repeat protein